MVRSVMLAGAACLTALIFSSMLIACAVPADKGLMTLEVFSPPEVPASFEMPLICRANTEDFGSQVFLWSASGGIIRGDGSSVRWQAPELPGEYIIDVKGANTGGMEQCGKIIANVLPFYRTKIDLEPCVNFELPLFGCGSASAVSMVRPLTTAVLKCEMPMPLIKKYRYAWQSNGGKFQGQGVKEGIAREVGWVAPGMAGDYTVTVTATDEWGGIFIGAFYCQVKPPSCCEN